MMADAQRHHIAIYGAGGAIGGALARAFAREGAKVFFADRTLARQPATPWLRARGLPLPVTTWYLDKKRSDARTAGKEKAGSALDYSKANPATYVLVGETGFEPATPWSRTAVAAFSPRKTAGHGVASSGKPEGRSACQDTQSTACDGLRSKICRPGVASDGAQVPGLSSEPLLSIREVAAQLAVCRATAYRLCQRGEIPHLRISNAIRVPQAALETFLASQDRKARPRRATPPPASCTR